MTWISAGLQKSPAVQFNSSVFLKHAVNDDAFKKKKKFHT